MSAADNSGLSAEDLDMLTPEERAAIEDGAEDAAEQELLSKLAKAAPDDDGDDDDDINPDNPDGDTQAQAPAPAAAADKEPPAKQTPTQDRALYRAELPADFAERQVAVQEQMAELRQKFKDGEIDADTYEAERESLSAQREEFSKAITKAEIAAEMRTQSAAQAWQSAIDRAFDQAKASGVDYRQDAEKAGDLDLFVRKLAESPANADKDMDWFLSEAHKRVLALHGVAQPKAPVAAAKPTSRVPPTDSLPKSLAQVPGSDGPGDVSGEFSDIDALDGDALEDRLRSMSPAEKDRYARGR